MTNYTDIFHGLVTKEMEATGKARNVAHMAVCRKHPEVREGFVAEHNALHRPGAVCRAS
jgi:hypothetical protein